MCFLVIGKYKERGVFCSSGHNAEAERFVKQARASGSISSVEGAADEYAAAKQARIRAGANEIADEKRLSYHDPVPPPPPFDMAQWKQQDYAESARWEQQQAYQAYRQGERSGAKNGGKPHYSIRLENDFPYRFPPHNFSRKPTPFRFDDPKYWNINGNYAARLAINNFKFNNLVYQFTEPGSTNCSNFVSHIWWQAGIRLPNSTWDIDRFKANPYKSDNFVWYRTEDQQSLFSSYHGEFRIRYSNVTGESGILRNQSSFNNILANYPQIFQPGSAVFYYSSNLYPGVPGWQHASILVDDARMPTNFFSTSSSSLISRPALVEQDGLFDSNGLPRDIRSLDDTPNTLLTQISIVPAQPIDTSLYNISPSGLPTASLDGKSCYIVQSGGEGNFSLYYCPPTVPAVP